MNFFNKNIAQHQKQPPHKNIVENEQTRRDAIVACVLLIYRGVTVTMIETVIVTVALNFFVCITFMK